jgi:PAS domain S-box-containing protein
MKRGYPPAVAEPGLNDALAVEADAFATALAETTQSLICVLDEEGRILLFNDACERATGFGRDEVLGHDARGFVIPPEEGEAFGSVLEQIWATGYPSPQVGHWMSKDGSRRLIVWSNRPVLGDDGRPRYLVTSGLDITERAAERTGELEGDVETRLVEIGLLAQEQRALRRVATLVASEVTPERVFAAVSEESARVLGVNASAVFRFDEDDTITVVGRWAREDVGAFPLGATFTTDEVSSVGRVRRTGFPARIDNWYELSGPVADTMKQSGYRCSVGAPIVVAGETWGAVSVADAEILSPESESRLAAFCELVSLAVASAQARTDLQASRARLVTSADNERRRLERNLHDGAQQRLVSLALSLQIARGKVEKNPAATATILDEASRELEQALVELRELARGLHPAILTDRGLAHALEALATRIPVPVELEVPDARFEPTVEAAAYYITAEALTNVARHAEASVARVTVAADGDGLRLAIVDDGGGGADATTGTGIVGLQDRAAAIGGSLAVVSTPGGGTTVTATLPLTPGI